MTKQTAVKEATEARLAFGFNDILGRELGEVSEEDVGVIANACATLLTSYLVQLAPVRRMPIVSELAPVV